jgi:5'-nucleotidase
VKYLILVTNDDGYRSEGIGALAKELYNVGDVYIVAPEEEKSAVSHAITLRDPIRIRQVNEKIYAVRGTPADCVILAVKKILPRKPDIVLSGINHGRNLGDDVMYSGTVAGAREACYLDIPAVAVSCVDGDRAGSLLSAAQFIKRLTGRILKHGIPNGTFLNVNVPSRKPIRGLKMTYQGSRLSRASLVEGFDPRGKKFYWIGEDRCDEESREESGSDYQAVEKGYISITPLQRDQTCYRVLEQWEHDPELSVLFCQDKSR